MKAIIVRVEGVRRPGWRPRDLDAVPRGAVPFLLSESFHGSSQNGQWMRSTGPTARDPLRTQDDDVPEPAARADSPPDPSPELSDEEVAVLRLIAEGLPIDSVAARLGMSPRTVRRRMHDVCERIGVTSTIPAVVWAAHHGLV